MTRPARILAPLLMLALCAEAAGPGRVGSDPLVSDVEGYLAGVEARDLRPAGVRPLLAQAAGGLGGWFLPQLHAWYPSLEGEISTEGGDIIDLEDDLGINSSSITAMPAIGFAIGDFGLRFDAFFVDLTGQSVVRGDFEFGGVDFEVGEPIESSVRLDQYRLMLAYAVIDTDNLRLSVQGGFALSLFDARITGERAGSADESAYVLLPLVGLVFQARVSRFLFEIDVSGMSLSFSGYGGTSLDAKASFGISIFKVAAVRVGYRYLWGKGDDSDFHADIVLQGFFIGLSAQF